MKITSQSTKGVLPGKSLGVRIAAVAGVVAILALAAPFIWGAVSAGAGLMALVIMGMIAVALMQAIPLLGQIVENRILGARKKEARENPIEQRQNEFRRRKKQIEEARKAMAIIAAQIEGMKDMIRDQRKKDPNYDFTKHERSVEKMAQFYTAKMRKIDEADQALEEFKKLIERNIYEWNFAQQGKAALESLNAADQESILQEMLSDEAGRAIQDRFNTVCAELDAEVSSLNTEKRLEFDNGMTLDVSGIRIPEMNRVGNGG